MKISPWVWIAAVAVAAYWFLVRGKMGMSGGGYTTPGGMAG